MFSTKQAKISPKTKGNLQESFIPYFEAEQAAKNMKRQLWTKEECYRYVLFLREKSDWFATETLRRQKRVFAEASKFVGTKNCKQIKSHHQKLLIKLKTIENIIESVLKPLESTEPSLKCIEYSKETSEVETPRAEYSIFSVGEFQNSSELFGVLEPSFLLLSDNIYDEQQFSFKKDSELINQFEDDI